MAQQIQAIHLIAIDPAVRHGRPYVLGTTLTVADVAIARVYHGKDADDIAAMYDLTLPQVYAALSYYYANQASMSEDIRQQIRTAEELKAQRVGNDRSLLSR